MSLTVALYAEGPAEDRGPDPWLPAAGEILPADALGAAHHLIARAIERDHRIPRAAIRFASPLRAHGRPHRGSDLHHGKSLRRLLTFAHPARRPQLGIVLVDEDGDADRRKLLIESTENLDLHRVIAVPIREFEAWLIADQQTLVDCLGVTETEPAVESLPPGRAKQLLQNWIAARSHNELSQSDRTAHTQRLRSLLAERVGLEVLDRLSAFQQFRDDLRDVMRLVA